MDDTEGVRAAALAGEAVAVQCCHEVCFVDNSRWNCLIRSGEVLGEYSTEEGHLAWAVYACNEEGELVSGGRHVAISSDDEFAERKKEELFERYVKEQEAEANGTVSQQKRERRTVEEELKRLDWYELHFGELSSDGRSAVQRRQRW